MIKLFTFTTLLIALCINCNADQNERSVYEKIFNGFIKAEDHFSQSFLAMIPEHKIREIVTYYTDSLGKFKNADGDKGVYTVNFEKGKCPSKISLDKEGLVTGIWFGNFEFFEDDLSKIRRELEKIAGVKAITITRNGLEKVFSHNGNRPLGVGSAFKLYILACVSKLVNEGHTTWNKIVRIKGNHRSLPTGLLQDWPEGSPITMRTLANLMISMSDNTATDHLLFLCGRENVEKLAPPRVRPFLSTGEMFKLKWGITEEELNKYLKADVRMKKYILKRISKFGLEKVNFTPDVKLINDIEWHITTEELCSIIYALKGNSSLSINPGLLNKSKWHYLGFKGGSEPGVLNYTHIMQKTDDSPVYCVSATINDAEKPVDTEAFTAIISRIIALIENGKVE